MKAGGIIVILLVGFAALNAQDQVKLSNAEIWQRTKDCSAQRDKIEEKMKNSCDILMCSYHSHYSVKYGRCFVRTHWFGANKDLAGRPLGSFFNTEYLYDPLEGEQTIALFMDTYDNKPNRDYCFLNDMTRPMDCAKVKAFIDDAMTN